MADEDPKPKEKKTDAKDLTLVEHLEELRTRLIWSLVGIVLGGGLAYWRIQDIVDLITQPYYGLTEKKLLVVAPMEAFLANLKIAAVAGLVLSCPLWIHQAWRFVSPGLYARERRYGLIVVPAASVLFVGGVVFSYVMVVPFALQFFVAQGEGFEIYFTLDRYLSFLVNFLLAFGLAFQMPIVMSGLAAVGILTPKGIAEKRGPVYIALAVVSAMLTPADVLSMILLLVPLVILFEGSLVVIKVFKIGKEHW